MHLKRIATAALLLPLFYFYIMKLPEAFFLALLLTLSVVAQWEFYSMYHVSGLMKNSGMFSGVLALLSAYLLQRPFAPVLIYSFMAIFVIRLFGKRDPVSSLRDVSSTVLAVLYIPGLLSFQLSLRHDRPEWIIFLFGCVWIADSFAYYIGKAVGKRKLYAAVSPNKTVAGAVGSLLGGCLAGWFLDAVLVHALGGWRAVAGGLVIGAVTIVGDLVESMFKRDAGVKDSSNIIPGHGGILDKIDGVLFAGPVFYWVSRAMGVIV